MLVSKKVKNYVMGFLLFIVIISFIFFYGFSKSGTNMDSFVVAKVDGTPVYLSEFKKEVTRLQDNYREQINQSENPEELNRQIYNTAISMLLQKYFILNFAKKNKVMPSNYEILATIANRPEFKTEDGKFNEPLFNRIPSYYKKNLESKYRDDLSVQLVQLHFYDAAKVTDTEIRNYFEMKNTKAKVAFVYEESQGDDLLTGGTTNTKKEVINDFYELLKKGYSFYSAASKTGLKVYITDYFSFAGKISGEKSTNNVFSKLQHLNFYKTAFSLKKGNISDVISLGSGKCVLWLINRKEPDWKDFYKEAFAIKRELLTKNMNDYFSDWLRSNIQKAKILNNMDRLFGGKS